MLERDNKKYLLRRVKELGGIARKIKYEGRNGASDWLITLPWRMFVMELKRPGKKPNKNQNREINRMNKIRNGVACYCDTTERIEEEISNEPEYVLARLERRMTYHVNATLYA